MMRSAQPLPGLGKARLTFSYLLRVLTLSLLPFVSLLPSLPPSLSCSFYPALQRRRGIHQASYCCRCKGAWPHHIRCQIIHRCHGQQDHGELAILRRWGSSRSWHVAMTVTSVHRLFQGKGTEDVSRYSDCKLQHLDSPNIHHVRESYDALLQLALSSNNSKWLSALESTGWLNFISLILKVSIFPSFFLCWFVLAGTCIPTYH